MMLVDLASRVLRDSDEVTDQELKQRVLVKLLRAWAAFTDLYEADLRDLPNLQEIVRKLHPIDDPTDEQVDDLKTALVSVVPSFITMSGMRTCLAASSLHRALGEVTLDNHPVSGLMRVVALYTSGSGRWIESLGKLDEVAIKTFFGSTFLSSIARFNYIVDESLTDDDRDAIRAFLRRVVSVRYKFDGPQERNQAMNRFEQRLRDDRLKRSRTIAIDV